MFEVGDLDTVDKDSLQLHLHANVYEQWSTNPFGIVVAVEGCDDGFTILVKVYFHSLGDAYWLRAFEVIHVSPPRAENE